MSAFGGLCIYQSKSLVGHQYSIIMNADEEVEVLCDHTTLHRSMAQAGINRAFINPLQTLGYETAISMIRRLLSGP